MLFLILCRCLFCCWCCCCVVVVGGGGKEDGWDGEDGEVGG